MASSETLAFDSSSLFIAAQSSLHHQPPPPLSLSTFPATFPVSKLIPKTRFVVDAFRISGDHSVSFFLSHFHSDHYSGLSSAWSRGMVFCSPVTARLLVEVLRVSSLFVVPLKLGEPVLIDGCEVTLVDANHCPGAIQFLFKVPVSEGKFERYVHTGDFRFCDSMRLDSSLQEFVGSEAVFLDTTYCDPKFVFPSQQESIEYVASVVERVSKECRGSDERVLFLVATYVIGKEKILMEIARRCDRKIYVDEKKMEVLRVLGCDISKRFTENQSESDVHVVGWNILGETWPYFRPNFVKMTEIMLERGYSKAIGFVPTGWTYEVKRNKFSVREKDSIEIHLVPYSEHSNYEELREFVRFLRPKRVIPTVGFDVEKLDSKHVDKMKKHFAGLVDETANKHEFLKVFRRGKSEMSDYVEKDTDDAIGPKQNQTKEARPSDAKVLEHDDIANPVHDSVLPLQKPGLQNLVELTDEDKDKTICELRDCLPSWVTRDQMLELTEACHGDIVAAVSTFYERETEFHEQVFACSTSECASQISLSNEPKPFLQSTTVMVSPLSQNHNSASTGHSLKIGVSPGKRKKRVENKKMKKVKMLSKSETSGSKQSTITRFFSKALPDTSVDAEKTLHEGSPKGKKLLSEDPNPCETEVNNFIQIVNGDESLKSYAATILDKAKGDMNKALDLHYSNSKAELGLVTDTKVYKSQTGINACCFSQREYMSKEGGNTADLSQRGLLIEDVDSTAVTLSPEKYDPLKHACWSDGQRAPYLHLARTFDSVESEKGKKKATSMMCNMFRSLLALSPEDVLPAVYLCTSKIAADHENMELNIGGSLVSSAVQEACGASRSKVREMYNELGDLGDVAQELRQTQTLLAPPPPLLIKDVFSTLKKISVQTGSGSTTRKKNLILNLMRSCREKEVKFLVRTLVRNLRIGAMLRTVLPALAQAVVMHSSHEDHCEKTVESFRDEIQSLSAAVVEAYNVVPSLDLIVPALINKGIQFLSTISMFPGIPIRPMLAKITNGVPQALKQFENKAFTCEFKYDGQRAQIHKLDDGSVRVFSRNGDESTSRFPDLINVIKESCKPDADTFILDAEVVGIDRKSGSKLKSFQELSSRGRGNKDTSVPLDSIKVDICAFVFDVMFYNGQKLLGFPLRERRKYLRNLFCSEKLGYLEYAREMTVEADDACSTSEATLSRISTFLENAFISCGEGIMIKTLDIDAGYSPSKRAETWLKVKKDYIDELNDSLDLVPIGAWHGNGRKAGWYSPFLMACYNPDTEEFQSVCRVMSGFSDSFYKEMKAFLSGDKVLSKKPPYYRTGEVPDMWFTPELVWEIRGADFTVSPVHEAAIGLVVLSRGISIRFPRFIGSVPDRKPEECSTAEDIAEMFHSQTRKMDVTTGH